MNESRKKGDDHVQQVCDALEHRIANGTWQKNLQPTVFNTASYLYQKFPQITRLESKFDHPNPDHHKDLTLHLHGQSPVPINLFLVNGSGLVQPKNAGAKSFLSKYFLADVLQDAFNIEFRREYQHYLQDMVELVEGTQFLSDARELKKKVRAYFPSFVDEEANECREQFLYAIREHCFHLLEHSFNTNLNGFANAFRTMLMTDEVNIVTRDWPSGDVTVEEYKPELPAAAPDNLKVYKSGNNSVGIQYGPVALQLRFKFENKPDSSIKVHATYVHVEDADVQEKVRLLENRKTLQAVERLLQEHHFQDNDSKSNAIGKCHEALAYARLLRQHPAALQVDETDCLDLLKTYAPNVEPEVLHKLNAASEKTAQTIAEHLAHKYGRFLLESIQLVPESYLDDRSDTADLKLILRVDGKYVTENISLKAVGKQSRVTTKNPGIGSILGDTYFDIGDLKQDAARVKAEFEQGILDHDGSQEALASELLSQLAHAPQQNLRRGVENLLGRALMVLTVYETGTCYCQEHSAITSDVRVRPHPSSKIQVLLQWNGGREQIALRVKFSRGKSHGWSSIKLTSEYEIKP